MLSEVIEKVRGAIEAFAQTKMPPSIDVKYPASSPMAGTAAGKLVLMRVDGGSRYDWRPAPSLDELPAFEAVAELVIKHSFTDLADFARYLEEASMMSVFARFTDFRASAVIAVDEANPQKGACNMVVRRHPAFSRWVAGAGTGQHVDMSHRELAELVLDNREDLDQPELATHLAAFRACRSVTFDADYGDAGHESVKVQWKGSGGKEGPTTDLSVPREFEAAFPAFTGAWSPGDEPRHVAIFRLRVLPPKGDDAPMFRITWINAADYELAASQALNERIKEVFGEDRVFAGSPESHRYVLPGKAKETP